MTNIEIPSLNNLSNKLYELINNENYDTNDINVFKEMINKYYDNITNNNKYLQEKELYYNTNINNPRIVQNELYETYKNERQELYDSWLKNKNIETIKNLSTFDKFDYKYIPEIYTYNFHINNNFGKKFKEQNKEDKQTQNDDFSDIEEVKEEVKEDKEEVKEEVKEDVKKEVKEEDIPNMKGSINNCTDKKEKECKEKGKICNPKTGRCIKNENKDKPKEQEIKQDIKEDDIPTNVKPSVNNCTDKKEKECKEKGKICNPKTGRCIKK
tara:strand:+ start:1534 stop:2340 length:807 start_codon:yes stop_codon:yes gene_type:complete